MSLAGCVTALLRAGMMLSLYSRLKALVDFEADLLTAVAPVPVLAELVRGVPSGGGTG